MSSNKNTNSSQKSAQQSTKDAAVNNVIAFVPRALDCSGDVDGTVDVIEHLFDTAPVIPLRPLGTASDDTTKGSPCLTSDSDANRRLARNSSGAVGPSGPARPNTEQADGLKSPGALMPATLPTGASSTNHGAAAPPPRKASSPPTGGLTGERSTDAGTLAHWLIGEHADTIARNGLPVDLPGLLEQAAYPRIEAIPARRRVLSIQAASLAHRYLHTYVPQSPWSLMRAEYDCGRGRVDLAWRNTKTGHVFFDEVKTGRRSASGSLPSTWVEQATRYSEAGWQRFGAEFLGTRLLPLHGRKEVVLVAADGTTTPVAPTASEPVGEWVAR